MRLSRFSDARFNELMLELMQAESAQRQKNQNRKRLKAAGFPYTKALARRQNILRKTIDGTRGTGIRCGYTAGNAICSLNEAPRSQATASDDGSLRERETKRVYDMCARYYIAEDDPEIMLAEYIAEARKRAQTMGVSIVGAGEVRPADTVPVIAPDAKDRQPAAFPMKWGPHVYQNTTYLLLYSPYKKIIKK